MIFLVPVSRFRVHYEVAEGYPFSQLQRLILRAVGDGVCSKDELVNTFRIHPRLLIEALVTLTHAGWVALGHSSDKQFLLTPAGARAVETEELPESMTVSRRHSYVLLERLSGSVIPEGEVRHISKRILQKAGIWNSCIEMPAQILDNKLDESRVHYLLPRQQGQRLHWVGPIEMVTKGDTFIPLSIEAENEVIINLPHRCERNLRPILLEAAKQEVLRTDGQGVLNWDDLTSSVRLGRSRSGNINVLGMPQENWPIAWSPTDLIRERKQYDEILIAALSTAQTSVLIAGRCATTGGLTRCEGGIMDALSRGVDVDVLWGFTDDPATIDWLKKRAYDAKRQGAAGRLRYNQAPSFSNAKVLLWDGPEGFCGAVGTQDWLVSPATSEQLPFGLSISHPAILSVLSWCAAGFWSRSQSETLSSVPDRWRRIAIDLESQLPEFTRISKAPSEGVSIRIILDREHSGLLSDWMASAQVRLLIASAKLDMVAERRLTRLHERRRATEFLCRVFFGETQLDDAGVLPIQRQVEAVNGVLCAAPGTRANVLVSDQSVCISSFSFLSGTVDGDHGAREIGVVIEGTEPSEVVAQRILHFVKTAT